MDEHVRLHHRVGRVLCLGAWSGGGVLGLGCGADAVHSNIARYKATCGALGRACGDHARDMPEAREYPRSRRALVGRTPSGAVTVQRVGHFLGARVWETASRRVALQDQVRDKGQMDSGHVGDRIALYGVSLAPRPLRRGATGCSAPWRSPP